MNTARALRRAFGAGAETTVTYWAPEPAYHLGSPVVFRFLKWMNNYLPTVLQPVIFVYVRKGHGER